MKYKCTSCSPEPPCILDTDGEAWSPHTCPWGNQHVKWVKCEGEWVKCEVKPENYDSVNRPSHYTEGRKYEPIDVIEDWELDFCLGNALKYISRAGRKEDEIEDLKKAQWYIKRKIKQLE